MSTRIDTLVEYTATDDPKEPKHKAAGDNLWRLIETPKKTGTGSGATYRWWYEKEVPVL